MLRLAEGFGLDLPSKLDLGLTSKLGLDLVPKLGLDLDLTRSWFSKLGPKLSPHIGPQCSLSSFPGNIAAILGQ